MAWSLKNLRVHHASGLVHPDNPRESTALHYVCARVAWTFHLAGLVAGDHYGRIMAENSALEWVKRLIPWSR